MNQQKFWNDDDALSRFIKAAVPDWLVMRNPEAANAPDRANTNGAYISIHGCIEDREPLFVQGVNDMDAKALAAIGIEQEEIMYKRREDITGKRTFWVIPFDKPEKIEALIPFFVKRATKSIQEDFVDGMKGIQNNLAQTFPAYANSNTLETAIRDSVNEAVTKLGVQVKRGSGRTPFDE